MAQVERAAGNPAWQTLGEEALTYLSPLLGESHPLVQRVARYME